MSQLCFIDILCKSVAETQLVFIMEKKMSCLHLTENIVHIARFSMSEVLNLKRPVSVL